MDAHQHAVASALDAALRGVRDPFARGVIAEHLVKALEPKRKRKPPESGLMVPAVPPHRPLPLKGGAEAPLEFE